ncbi:MAG: hypothetical protein DMF30_07130 [Verrucomicrobia bacterium]|nr:MAG: hypothetical protein DMF30_07130 [Verrucomicrobiota bacterium]
MKLSRTKEYNFGWLVLFPLLDVAFLLVFFLLLSSNFILQPGISVSMPFSRFTLGPQINQQIISITGGAAPAIYFRDQRITLEQLGPLLEAAKREGRSIIIKADRLTPYETVVEVTNAALEHGIPAVALATTTSPENGDHCFCRCVLFRPCSLLLRFSNRVPANDRAPAATGPGQPDLT